MSYKVRLSQINPDFSFQPPPEGDWTNTIEDDDGLIFLMNRVAVAASQDALVDFPEIEITKGSRRVNVTAVSGQLIYNDAHTSSRQNLKVIPDEVIRLLEGKPLDEVFLDADEKEIEAPEVRYRKSIGTPKFKAMALAVMLGSLCWAAFVIKQEYGTSETLIGTPRFIHNTEGAEEVLKNYQGVGS